ncbi:MAG: alpha/beta fold hydrolase [Bacteriovoracaceae bacterium]
MNGREEMIKMADNLELYSRIYESGKNHWLVAVHGIGEHCDRHEYLVDLFRDRFNICLFDLRGHGRSEGRRTFISNFRDFYNDLYDVLKFLKTSYRMEKYDLFGHSMGGLISVGFCKFFASESVLPEKLLVNAPPVGVGGVTGKIVNQIPTRIINGLTDLPYTLRLSGLINLDYLSHDPAVKSDYLSDDLINKNPHSKLLLELIKASRYVFSGPLGVDLPILCTAGSEDEVIDFDLVKDFFEHEQRGSEFKAINGAYHEIHLEIEKYRKPYFQTLRDFLITENASFQAP